MLYVPPFRQTTLPGWLVEEAPLRVLGVVGEVPLLPSFPLAAAYSVQSVATAACATVGPSMSTKSARASALAVVEIVAARGAGSVRNRSMVTHLSIRTGSPAVELATATDS